MVAARLLADNRAVKVIQEREHLYLQDLPSRAPDRYDTVIELQVQGKPKECPGIVHLWQDGVDTGPLADWVRARLESS